MVWYILRRIAAAGVVAVLLITFLAVIANFVPGDPAAAILGSRATPELAALARREMGLDLPVYQQVVMFFGAILQGDLGRDFVSGVPVTEHLSRVLPHTIILAFASLGVGVAIAIPLGVLAASRRGSWVDRTLGAVSIWFITVPSFVLALMLMLVGVAWLRIFPALGAGDLSDPVDYTRHLILPMTALALPWAGYLSRLVRTNMIDVLELDYVRSARALGLSKRRVYFVYALRNALVPTLSIVAAGLGGLLGGALFVEVIFARPGLGSLMVDALNLRNYPVVRGGALVAALLFMTVNICMDLAYRYIDPRIRVEQGNQG